MPENVTRVKSKTPMTSESVPKGPHVDESNQWNPSSLRSPASNASSVQSGLQVLSSNNTLVHGETRPHGHDFDSARSCSSSREDARLKTASVVSTNSGLSVSGMSGVEAASVFMDEASKTLLIDSATEVLVLVFFCLVC
jgi:hypothetical protein